MSKFSFPGSFKSTGVPEGFSEMPRGFFIYMIIRGGRIVFISAGKSPWPQAERLCAKYQADRVVYKSSTVDAVEDAVAALVTKYQPPYNFKSQSVQLSELNAILDLAEN